MTTLPGASALGAGIHVVILETPGLGDRSYVVSHEGSAVVIDPQRDIDRVLAVAERDGLEITHVLETHIHNDYVTGGYALATATGAEYGIPGGEDVSFAARPIAHGDRLTIAGVALRAVHTPGHTPSHLSYVLEQDRADLAVFSGGSLLHGTVGRTDLLGEHLARQLAAKQYRSARHLIRDLPDMAAVYPTHGFGSFCTSMPVVEDESAPSNGEVTTIGRERATNTVMLEDDEARFVDRLLAGLTPFPAYYAHMGPANRAGPASPDLRPLPDLSAASLADRIAAGEWVVDLRSRRAFAASHLAGSVGFELQDSFVTYLGWLIPWGTPVTLLADTAEDVADAQRALSRIGVDWQSGRVVGGRGVFSEHDDVSAYRVAGFAELAAEIALPHVVVLDVRRPDEWAEGHVAGAVHLPLYEIEDRFAEVPDKELWVHCRTGYRASIAASLLDRRNRNVVLVDDDWEHAGSTGIEIVTA